MVGRVTDPRSQETVVHRLVAKSPFDDETCQATQVLARFDYGCCGFNLCQGWLSILMGQSTADLGV